jgi:hypothetical protein
MGFGYRLFGCSGKHKRGTTKHITKTQKDVGCLSVENEEERITQDRFVTATEYPEGYYQRVSEAEKAAFDAVNMADMMSRFHDHFEQVSVFDGK